MVILGGWVFLMSKVPLYESVGGEIFEAALNTVAVRSTHLYLSDSKTSLFQTVEIPSLEG